MSKNNSISYPRRYFLGVSGYTTPPKPGKEVKYIDTQSLNSYYWASVDGDGKILCLEKILIGRELLAVPVVNWRAHKNHRSGMRFFEFTQKNGACVLEKELSLEETEALTEYVSIMEDDSGAIQSAQKIRKSSFFWHAYSYWENGKLKEWRHSEKGGAELVTCFDQGGKQINNKP